MKELDKLSDSLVEHAEITAKLIEITKNLRERVSALEVQQQLEVREINDALIFFSMKALTDSYPHLREILIERLKLLMEQDVPEHMHKEAITAGCQLLIEHLSADSDHEVRLRPDWFRGVIQGKKNPRLEHGLD